MKLTGFILAIIWSCNLASAQYSIRGKVTTASGEALTGANIYIRDSYKGAVSGLDGSYLIQNLDPGSHTIIASFIGYKDHVQTIELSSDVGLCIHLEPTTTLAEETIITGLRAGQDAPVAFQNLEKEDIEHQNKGRDIPFLLSSMPSTVITSDAGAGVGYTGLSIRGTGVKRINVTVNGIPLNDAESHGVWWVNMPDFANSVENVQVQRGVGTSTLGAGAFGASLNFQTTKLNPEPYVEIDNSGGSFNTLRNSISLGSGRIRDHFSFDMRLSRVVSDGFIDRAGSNLKSFFVSGGYHAERHLLKFNIFSGQEETYQAWYGVPSAKLEGKQEKLEQLISDFGYTDSQAENLRNSDARTYNFYTYENETDNYQQDHYQLIYSTEINPLFHANVALHYTRGRGYYEQFREDEPFSSYRLGNVILGSDTLRQTDMIRRLWLDNHFFGAIASIQWKKKGIEATLGGGWNHYLGDHYGRIIWAEYASNSDIRYEWYNGTGDKIDFNLYNKWNVQLSNSWSILADVQVRRILYDIRGEDEFLRDVGQRHDFLFVNPKAGVSFKPVPGHRLFAYFGIANREPNRANFVDHDPARTPPTYETLRDYELGYTISASNYKTSLNLYYMDYKDQLVHTGEINEVGSPIMTNIPDSYRAGIEWVAGYRPFDPLLVEFNATLSRNKIFGYTDKVDNWDYWSDPGGESFQKEQYLGETHIAFSPELIMNGSLRYEPIENLSFDWTSKYVGKQYIDNTSSDDRSLDPYFVNDLSVNYAFGSRFANEIFFSVSVHNILDHHYEAYAWIYRYYIAGEYKNLDGYFPQAGRYFMAAVNFRF